MWYDCVFVNVQDLTHLFPEQKTLIVFFTSAVFIIGWSFWEMFVKQKFSGTYTLHE